MKLQYPKIEGNKLYDGKEHTINPIKLNQIEGYELYLLDYYDEKYQRECTTILEKDDEGFKKVSLLNYDIFLEKIANNELHLIKTDFSKFGFTDDAMLIESKKPNKDFEQYIHAYRELEKEPITLYIDEWYRIWDSRDYRPTHMSREDFLSVYYSQTKTIFWKNRKDGSRATSEQIKNAVDSYLMPVNESYFFPEDYFEKNGENYSNKKSR